MGRSPTPRGGCSVALRPSKALVDSRELRQLWSVLFCLIRLINYRVVSIRVDILNSQNCLHTKQNGLTLPQSALADSLSYCHVSPITIHKIIKVKHMDGCIQRTSSFFKNQDISFYPYIGKC